MQIVALVWITSFTILELCFRIGNIICPCLQVWRGCPLFPGGFLKSAGWSYTQLKPLFIISPCFLFSFLKLLFITFYFLNVFLLGWNFSSALILSGTMVHQRQVIKIKVIIMSHIEMWKFNNALGWKVRNRLIGKLILIDQHLKEECFHTKVHLSQCRRCKAQFNSLILSAAQRNFSELRTMLCNILLYIYGTIFRSSTYSSSNNRVQKQRNSIGL